MWPCRCKSILQGLEVVDLAVEHDRDRAVLVRDRRIAGLEIDDRQTVLADHRVLRGEAAVGVGAAVVEGVELGLDDRTNVAGLARDEPTDAAHQAAAVGGTLVDMPGPV